MNAPPLLLIAIPTTVGVLLLLVGLGLGVMGLIGVAARERRRGALGVVIGAGLATLGLWIVGAF
jgi:hypothetical protein